MEPTSGCCGYKKIFLLIVGILLAAFLGGIIILGKGIYQWRAVDHYVSVKGIAERSVKADLAIWDVGYKITGDNLAQITEESLKNQKTITDFLNANNFLPSEIEAQRMEVLDQYAKEYVSSKPEHRYIITSGVTLRSSKVDLVRKISQMSAGLIQQGIVLMNKNEYLPNPRYFFTKLDEVRPQMFEQATKSARLVAEQFAVNSGCQLGTIRRATQGVFQILNIDSNGGQNYGNDNDQIGNINKVVRVVVSVDYLLI